MFSSLYWAKLVAHVHHKQGAPRPVSPVPPQSAGWGPPKKHSLVEEGEEIAQDHQHRSRQPCQEAAHALHSLCHSLQLCGQGHQPG